VRPGQRVRLPHGGGRQWHYLAVRGGLEVPVVLGSRSHDTLSGLGATVLTAGTDLPIGPDPQDPVADVAPIPPVGDVARVAPGPRVDWFAGDPLEALTAAPLTITATSRIGVRLRGASLVRARADELPSEGLVRGAVQVPPDGDPIMMLADHPTTGGYPVVAVVHPADVATIAQHLEGTSVRLRR
jgi:allophanate hydrolase subunit 2